MTRIPHTQVQFPRFEYEDDPNLQIHERKLFRRGQPQQWLSPLFISLMEGLEKRPRSHPVTLYEWSKIERAKNNWWGEFLVTEQRTLPSVSSLSASSMRREIFSAVIQRHEYSWDHQALPGMATELVLRAQTDPTVAPNEVMAVLQTAGMKRQEEGQLLVINEGIGWHEPSSFSDDRVQSLLFAAQMVLNGAPLTDK